MPEWNQVRPLDEKSGAQRLDHRLPVARNPKLNPEFDLVQVLRGANFLSLPACLNQQRSTLPTILQSDQSAFEQTQLNKLPSCSSNSFYRETMIDEEW